MSLKSRTLQIVQKLRENGNQFVITSRSRCREFLGSDCIEFVHRLSGEKVISEEFAEFNSNIPTQILIRIIAFLPLGYLITSRIKSESSAGGTAIVKVEQMQFVSTDV